MRNRMKKTAVTVFSLFTAIFMAAICLRADGPDEFMALPLSYTSSDTVTMEVFFPDGRIERVTVKKEDAFPELKKRMTPAASASAAPLPPPNIIKQMDNGPDSNRICMIMEGDGFQAAEMPDFAAQAQARLDGYFAENPFSVYKNYFNCYRIETPSVDSGVSNDPTNGVTRNTALGMYYWCSGIARLICADTTTCWNYALMAPKADTVIVLANSNTYGGAGYPNLATAAANRVDSDELVLHESGHSFGLLTDEYWDTFTYSGFEFYPSPSLMNRNMSIYQQAAQVANKTKWYLWMGVLDPTGSNIDTYEGGATNYEYGVWRPTITSKMRALGNPYNNIGREAIIINIYNRIKPVDSYTDTSNTLTCGDSVAITTQQPVGFNLDSYWLVDGVTQTAQNGARNVLISDLAAGGSHQLVVRVVDNNPAVKDEYYRSLLMTQSITWNIKCESPTSTPSGTPTVTVTPTWTFTATITMTSTMTVTETITPTPTLTATLSETPEPTLTCSASWTFTQTVTLTATPTPTGTNTATMIYSSTFTPTYSMTVSPTPEATPTAVSGPEKLEFGDGGKILLFPDPYGGNGILKAGFSLTKNASKFSMKLYTSGFRRVRDFNFTGAYFAGENVSVFPGQNLSGLASGTYYFIAEAEDDTGNRAKSKIGILILIK
jgi:hypothetical protein